MWMSAAAHCVMRADKIVRAESRGCVASDAFRDSLDTVERPLVVGQRDERKTPRPSREAQGSFGLEGERSPLDHAPSLEAQTYF